jgi:hypothetical protein
MGDTGDRWWMGVPVGCINHGPWAHMAYGHIYISTPDTRHQQQAPSRGFLSGCLGLGVPSTC